MPERHDTHCAASHLRVSYRERALQRLPQAQRDASVYDQPLYTASAFLLAAKKQKVAGAPSLASCG